MSVKSEELQQQTDDGDPDQTMIKWEHLDEEPTELVIGNEREHQCYLLASIQ